ncbi:MAG: hypothetical protein ACKVOU_05830 [Cytophagales bacterium]
MNKTKPRLILGLFFMLSLLLFQCETEKRIEVRAIQLQLKVEDDNLKPLDNIPVYIFNNFESYAASVKNNYPFGFEKMRMAKSGKVVFDSLSNIANYWIFISYRDSARYLNMKNYLAYNSLFNNLPLGSVTTGFVQVRPSNGIISFWTADFNNANLPLTVLLKDSIFGNIDSTKIAEPSSPFDIPALTFNREPGKYMWYVKGENDCLWTGDTLLKAGQHIKIKVPECNNGNVAFWADTLSVEFYPITVVLNNSDTIGVIPAASSFVPTLCNEVNTAFAPRPSGTYSYGGFAASGTCVWSGSFTLAKSECKILKLEACTK